MGVFAVVANEKATTHVKEDMTHTHSTHPAAEQKQRYTQHTPGGRALTFSWQCS